MPSFDIASTVDVQTLDNAVNIVKKEITNRFDFKDNHVLIELNKKEYLLKLESDSEMKIQQIVDVLISRSMKQGIEATAFDFSDRKSTRLNSSHSQQSRMPSSA